MPDQIRDIGKFCNELATEWSKVPNWRFGQFMINVLSEYIRDTKLDPFYVEDEDFIKYIRSQFFEENKS